MRFSDGECGVIVEAEVVFEPENGGTRADIGSSRKRANEGTATAD